MDKLREVIEKAIATWSAAESPAEVMALDKFLAHALLSSFDIVEKGHISSLEKRVEKMEKVIGEVKVEHPWPEEDENCPICNALREVGE